MSSGKLRILPLGGLGEIGMNCLVLEWGNDIVLIDCGVQFPDASYAGVDILTPDLRYVRERKDRIRGVVCTHGHDDHIGAIPFLLRETPLDIYCTPFPEGLIRQKLTEYQDLKEATFHTIKPRQPFTVGPFTFDPIPVAHSIIEALGFAIQTPIGIVVHSGDFKHDPKETLNGETKNFAGFAEWGAKGVRLLLSDSTNAERLGHTISELDIAKSFEKILSEQTGRTFIALFASNIKRIEKLLAVAHKLGKKVAFGGRSMHSYTKLAFDQSSLKIPPETLVLLEDLDNYADDRVIIMLTGSQAEPQSALVRISQNIHKEVEIRSGDTIMLSSRFIPGNERNITAMIDHLYRLGAEVIYESIHQIHVSGHGFQEELLMLLEAVKPECFVPLHGEYRHLAKHAKLARSSGVGADNIRIIEDGQVLEIDEKTISLGERLELEKGIIVSGVYMEGGKELFTQRANLAKTGIVMVALVRDRRTKKLIHDPLLAGYGLLFKKEVNPDDAFDEVRDVIDDAYPDLAESPELKEALRLEVRRFFRKRVSHKPVVVSLIIDV